MSGTLINLVFQLLAGAIGGAGGETFLTALLPLLQGASNK